MDYGNQTLLTELILVGFTQNFQACILLFVLFFIMYILTILGNCFLIFTIIVSPQLHTPMYYFLCNLSFIDLGYTSCSLPKILLDLLSKTRTISVTGCLMQMNFGYFLGVAENILLAVMAYDRYIAICFPLHYTVIMSWRLLVLELSCGDLTTVKTFMMYSNFVLLISPLLFIVVSYICIIISVLKIHSAGGRSKAFSTCASHLTVARFSSSLKYIALVYGVGTPVLNPFIYSLRNNKVKEAFMKILTKNFLISINH
ncbi:hypothetical protein GDO78_020712 [Eleutherodactylus coqui]|uniref:G-protein coupled receptors family 1 profile domain-containing protein n=1 Tax=Eleutherodactylus coqui TaxID=57060 RepID=A0A8J6EHV7_ELECQ|nr:hypothetical protein GDO78_020712 [Eleutherodactylus coqui]